MVRQGGVAVGAFPGAGIDSAGRLLVAGKDSGALIVGEWEGWPELVKLGALLVVWVLIGVYIAPRQKGHL